MTGKTFEIGKIITFDLFSVDTNAPPQLIPSRRSISSSHALYDRRSFRVHKKEKMWLPTLRSKLLELDRSIEIFPTVRTGYTGTSTTSYVVVQ